MPMPFDDKDAEMLLNAAEIAPLANLQAAKRLNDLLNRFRVFYAMCPAAFAALDAQEAQKQAQVPLPLEPAA